jgi:hypothetical protein
MYTPLSTGLTTRWSQCETLEKSREPALFHLRQDCVFISPGSAEQVYISMRTFTLLKTLPRSWKQTVSPCLSVFFFFKLLKILEPNQSNLHFHFYILIYKLRLIIYKHSLSVCTRAETNTNSASSGTRAFPLCSASGWAGAGPHVGIRTNNDDDPM